MNWNMDLVRRASIVVEELACEIVDSDDYSKRIVVVTDCTDETQKAIFTDRGGTPLEASSSFKSAERQQTVDEVIKDNWSLLRKELYE